MLPVQFLSLFVGDTIYFDACDASQSYGNEMYAFNTVNGSYWRVADLDSGTDLIHGCGTQYCDRRHNLF